MNSFKNFFLFCSGITPNILKRSPIDSNKYAGIGATIFFTGVFAAVSAGFAIFTVFKSYTISILFGVLWGLMIFNLDRFIVMSMKKKGSFFKEFVTATPRIILAILIAFVISKPLELKLFQSEINGELVLMEQEVYKNQEDRLRLRFSPSIDSLKSELVALDAQIKEKKEFRDELNLIAMQEADGTGGSKKANLGPIYATKKKDANQAQVELEKTEAEITPLITDKRLQLTTLEAKMDQQLTDLKQSNLDGFASQLNALGSLSNKSKTIWMASLFITLLFIAIETAPIFTKLIADRSPYDYRLDEHESLYRAHHLTATSRLNNEVNNDVIFDKEVQRFKNQQAITAEKDIIKELIDQEVENIKQKPLSWQAYIKNRNVFGSL